MSIICSSYEKGTMPAMRIWTKDFALLTIVQMMDMLAFNMITPVIAKYTLEQGVALALSGLAASAFAVAALVSRPFSGYLADRFGRRRIALVSIAVALSQQLWLFLIAAVLKALGSGTVTPSIQATCGRLETPERAGIAMSTYHFGTDIGNVFGPIIGGMLVASVGYDGLFFGALPLVAFCAIVSIAWYARARKSASPTA